MTQYKETVVIGGGQAGLSVSYFLKQEGRDHVVLEKASAPADAWRNQRWDSFTLVTPNWMTRLPGAPYDGNDPDGFMPRSGVVRYFDEYAARFELPVKCGARVASVERTGDGYLVTTNNGGYTARNVVVATGTFQLPRIPPFARNLPANIRQFHAGDYRNPDALQPGAVLVVGSAQSGCQITEELYRNGRKVYLCVGSTGRVPRRYRGRDITWWFNKTGMFDVTSDMLASPRDRVAPNPQVTGRDGGHSLNVHQFARDGVVLLGRIRDIQNGTIHLDNDLPRNLEKIDAFESTTTAMIDEAIRKNGMDIPEETLPKMNDAYASEIISELDVHAAGITNVVWAMGFMFDTRLVRLPVYGDDGYPMQNRGITAFPGLYFVGLQWMHTRKSGLLFGVGEDAEYVAMKLMSRPEREQH